jgi:5'-nucleotidase
VGGATFTSHFDNPTGQRLLSATVGGKPLDDGRVYHVVTIDYLCGGGDGHTEFKDSTNPIFGDIEVDAVAAYMTAHSPLDPKVEGRILQAVVPPGMLAVSTPLRLPAALLAADAGLPTYRQPD